MGWLVGYVIGGAGQQPRPFFFFDLAIGVLFLEHEKDPDLSTGADKFR